jgi:hypothetical protein
MRAVRCRSSDRVVIGASLEPHSSHAGGCDSTKPAPEFGRPATEVRDRRGTQTSRLVAPSPADHRQRRPFQYPHARCHFGQKQPASCHLEASPIFRIRAVDLRHLRAEASKCGRGLEAHKDAIAGCDPRPSPVPQGNVGVARSMRFTRTASSDWRWTSIPARGVPSELQTGKHRYGQVRIATPLWCARQPPVDSDARLFFVWCVNVPACGQRNRSPS